MSIKSRKQKILQAASTACIVKTDKNGHPKTIRIKGSKDNYQVNFKIGVGQVEGIDYFVFEASCVKLNGWHDCKGNSNGYVCYHSLAGLQKRAQWSGKKLILVKSFQSAVNLLNFGGQLIKISSTQGEGYCWGVVSGIQ